MLDMPNHAQNEATHLPGIIGRFRILRLLGTGAMSRVYLAFDPIEQKQVALKILADHLSGNKQFVNRFYREALMSMRFKHERVIAGLDSGYDQDAGKHYLVLEYIDGPTAAAKLAEQGPYPLEEVLRIGLEIGRALHALHLQGFVHRDVKPENILLGADGFPKLIDLGLMKRINGDAELTSTNQGVGTPQYMPYEQSVNGELVDARSDLFALAASLYHLACGKLPFSGSSHEEMTREKELDAYRPITNVRPNLPPLLDGILARALARDPRARYETAADMIAAFLSVPLPEASEHRPEPTDLPVVEAEATRFDLLQPKKPSSGSWMRIVRGAAMFGAVSLLYLTDAPDRLADFLVDRAFSPAALGPRIAAAAVVLNADHPRT